MSDFRIENCDGMHELAKSELDSVSTYLNKLRDEHRKIITEIHRLRKKGVRGGTIYKRDGVYAYWNFYIGKKRQRVYLGTDQEKIDRLKDDMARLKKVEDLDRQANHVFMAINRLAGLLDDARSTAEAIATGQMRLDEIQSGRRYHGRRW
ncbi:hypothetical protein HED60_23110 [Planctomycetales bacterium ZRK34]|nr:hypothetical protein HED60_23110 [Planctomycetales bacterium ZRK34]